jgi:hypothetical protein
LINLQDESAAHTGFDAHINGFLDCSCTPFEKSIVTYIRAAPASFSLRSLDSVMLAVPGHCPGMRRFQS